MINGMLEIPFSLEIVIHSTIQVWQCTLYSLWSCSETASRCDSQITYLSKEMAVWHKLCVRWIVIECNFSQTSNFVVPGFIWGLFPTFYFIFTLPQILFKVISLMVGTLAQDNYKWCTLERNINWKMMNIQIYRKQNIYNVPSMTINPTQENLWMFPWQTWEPIRECLGAKNLINS